MARLAGQILGSIKVLGEPDLYQMILRVYFPLLFPLTFLITLVALQTDALFAFEPLLPSPFNYFLAGVTFVLGAGLWTHTYAALVYGGDGSPSPVVRRTQRLVTTGIYAYCRNPSVHGKLMGFLAVGFAVNSTSFCLILTPIILGVSLIEKAVRQEPQLVEFFGDEYLAYREQVPLFLPFPGLHRWLKQRRGAGPHSASTHAGS